MKPNLPSKLSGNFSTSLVPLTSTASMTDSSEKTTTTTKEWNYYQTVTHKETKKIRQSLWANGD